MEGSFQPYKNVELIRHTDSSNTNEDIEAVDYEFGTRRKLGLEHG
jgi:hypothetical protein